MTQLFGDRLMIANATGCSSIYGGNLPTTPYAQNAAGRGPTWSNSLFEDNAEFGLGMRLATLNLQERARYLLSTLGSQVGGELVAAILEADPKDAQALAGLRKSVADLKRALADKDLPAARELLDIADYLVPKSVWLLGGDGWAYDIDYGGLDHVLSLPYNVNALVLDTEVYSNTGGQASKSTPLGAAAKFAASGKEIFKKDMGLMAMSYGHVYVASVCQGASDTQMVKAFTEAESYDGPSLIIAYSPCIAHGYDLINGPEQQKLAVESGVWPLYRFDPRLVAQGKPPLQLDSKPPKRTVQEYMRNETRFRMVEKIDPQRFRRLAQQAQQQTAQRVAKYEQLAKLTLPEGPLAAQAQS
jgi:pyruvate-ferredoxin/flavodoxin oxidoreductase